MKKLRPRWTKEEADFLTEHYSTVNTELLANILGRDVKSIRGKARSLRLKKLEIDKQKVIRKKPQKNPYGHAFAYLLHIAHQNGAADINAITKCMDTIREGALDNMIVKNYKDVV